MQGAIITGGNKIISYQVVRVEQFTKGSLGKIGGETERTSKRHRNEDIDSERTPLNLYFKKSDGGLTAQWKKTMQELGSNKKHTTKYQWQKAQQEAELASLEQEKVHAESIIQEAETAVETRDKALEEMKPLQEYLDAFKEAMSGELPFSPSKLKKMLIGLMTEYKRLEKKVNQGQRQRKSFFGIAESRATYSRT